MHVGGRTSERICYRTGLRSASSGPVRRNPFQPQLQRRLSSAAVGSWARRLGDYCEIRQRMRNNHIIPTSSAAL